MSEHVEIKFRNFYYHCGATWESDWDSMCNDKCPVCNKEIEPYHSHDIEMVSEEWAAKYKPIGNKFVPGERMSVCGGEMFEAFDKEQLFVQNQDVRTIWTLIRVGGLISVVPGFHHVNRIGYFVTRVPYDQDVPLQGYLLDAEPPSEEPLDLEDEAA